MLIKYRKASRKCYCYCYTFHCIFSCYFFWKCQYPFCEPDTQTESDMTYSGLRVLYRQDGVGSGIGMSSISGLQLPAACVWFKDSIENTCAVSQPPPFFSFFFSLGRRNETRCYKTRGKIPGKSKSCFQLILYILLAQFMSFSPSPLHFHCLHLHLKWLRWTVQSKGHRSRTVSPGFPGLDWDRFCVLRDWLPFLWSLEKISHSLGLHTVSGSFLQIFWASVGGKEQAAPPSPCPLLLPQTPTSFVAAAAAGSAWEPKPPPHTIFPQVKINKMSVSWLLFGLHLTYFFLF